jgi:putative tryptophan/tyrosine transport system substrate-binding protein
MRRIGLAVVVALSLTLAPLASEAQQAEKVYRIGMLERTSKTLNAASLNGFLRGMQELGYVEGKHFVIEYRSADGLDERFPELATDLVRVKVDLIVTRGTQAILATKNATNTIPIVITGAGDPIAQGIVASLARPGGNITGLNPMVTELYPKRVELLRALVPKAVRIAALCNMSSPAVPPAWKEVSARRDPWASKPSSSTFGRLEIWGPRSRERSSSVPMGSSSPSTPSPRRIASSSSSLLGSIGCRRSTHLPSSSGDWRPMG